MALKPPSRPLLPVIGFTLPLGWIDWQPRIDGIHRKWLLWRKKQKPNKTNREQGGPSWLQSPRIPCLELARSLRTKRRFIFSAVPLQLIDGATHEDPPECGTVPSNWSSVINPELLFSRRRRRGIIRDPKGLFPRRLLCLDEVWAQTCKSFLFFLLSLIIIWTFICTCHHSEEMHHLSPHAVSSPTWRWSPRLRGRARWTAFS